MFMVGFVKNHRLYAEFMLLSKTLTHAALFTNRAKHVMMSSLRGLIETRNDDCIEVRRDECC